MAKIRVIKMEGSANKKNPKIMYFHKDNFDKATTRVYSKYNIVAIGQKQMARYWDNKEKAINNKKGAYATVRFHTKGS